MAGGTGHCGARPGGSTGRWQPLASSTTSRSIPVSASSVNYGVMAPADAYSAAALQGACPIVGSFGGKDRNLRGAAGKLERALETLAIDHDVKEYPQAGHAFMNDHRGEGPWSVLYVVLGHLPVIAGYVGACHQPSAQDARRRILWFFNRHLKAVT